MPDSTDGAAAHAAMREQSAHAVSLAIARYAKDHPEAREQAANWADPAIRRFLTMSVEEIANEASRRLDWLAQWEADTRQNHPEVWESDRVRSLQAELSLQSAKTGHFGTAAGGLYDFLQDVGADVQELDEH